MENIYTEKNYKHYLYFDIILMLFGLVKNELQNSSSSRFWPDVQTPAVPKQVMGYGIYLYIKKVLTLSLFLYNFDVI
jgi:hypothetical protein